MPAYIVSHAQFPRYPVSEPITSWRNKNNYPLKVRTTVEKKKRIGFSLP